MTIPTKMLSVMKLVALAMNSGMASSVVAATADQNRSAPSRRASRKLTQAVNATTGTTLNRNRRGSGWPRLSRAPHTTCGRANAVLSGKTCRPCPATSCRTDQAYIQSSLNARGGDRSKRTRRSSPTAASAQMTATGQSSGSRRRPARPAAARRASGQTILREQ